MKITLIRKDEEQGTEALSLCNSDGKHSINSPFHSKNVMLLL